MIPIRPRSHPRRFGAALRLGLATWLMGLTCLAPAAWGAAPSLGLTALTTSLDAVPVTVYYPSSTPEAAVQRGPFTLQAADEGVPRRGNGRLLVISHGTGASPWTYSDLARTLVQAGFIVAMPEHRGDNWHDQSLIGPPSWKRRPAEVSMAIDAVLADARFGTRVDAQRIGVYGMSAGGHTALALAGGRWSPAALVRHCEAHLAEDFAACVGGSTQLDGNLLDGPKKMVASWIIHWKFADDTGWYGQTDPRIRAVVAAVPWAANFDLATLAHPPVPLGLIEAGQDRWLRAEFHAGAVLRECPGCEALRLPEAGHGALLSPLPPDMPPRLQQMLADGPGFDPRSLPAMYDRVADFFRRHLGVDDAAWATL